MPESVWTFQLALPVGFGQEGVMREHEPGRDGIFNFRSAEELGRWLAPLFDGVCTRHGHGNRAKGKGGVGPRTHRNSSRS